MARQYLAPANEHRGSHLVVAVYIVTKNVSVEWWTLSSRSG